MCDPFLFLQAVTHRAADARQEPSAGIHADSFRLIGLGRTSPSESPSTSWAMRLSKKGRLRSGDSSSVSEFYRCRCDYVCASDAHGGVPCPRRRWAAATQSPSISASRAEPASARNGKSMITGTHSLSVESISTFFWVPVAGFAMLSCRSGSEGRQMSSSRSQAPTMTPHLE